MDTQPSKHDVKQERAELVRVLRGFVKQMDTHLPGLWKLFDQARADRHIQPWPNWCFLPIDIFYAIMARYPNYDISKGVAPVAAVAAWRATQGIYEFDPTVFESLVETPLEGEIPF